MSQLDSNQVSQFTRTVDEFMQRYAKLTAPDTRAIVMQSGDASLIQNYRTTVNRGATLKASIEATLGAWNTVKPALQEMTDTASMGIGDAIDKIRSWFGYDPSGGLGALQLPAVAWITGIIASCVLLNTAMRNLFVMIEATKLQRENPSMPRDVAFERARSAAATNWFGGLSIPGLLGAVAIGALAYWAVK